MNLTDVAIRNLKPPKTGQKAYYDDAIPGFSVRVSQGGIEDVGALCMAHRAGGVSLAAATLLSRLKQAAR